MQQSPHVAQRGQKAALIGKRHGHMIAVLTVFRGNIKRADKPAASVARTN
jgi:hypothetical protein